MKASPTAAAVVYTELQDSAGAGRDLGSRVLSGLGGEIPDALILFISPRYNAQVFVDTVIEVCRPGVVVGCSSAGEFTSQMQGDGLACAIAIRSSDLRFAAGIGRGISADRKAAAQAMIGQFAGVDGFLDGYSSALVLTDALAGHADELIEELTICTGGNYQFFGGGAGDDANFQRTQVICGNEVCSDAAVVLEILSRKPIGVGVRHGWRPVGEPMRVTEVRGSLLVSLNAMRAVDAFAEHARVTGQEFDLQAPGPFFLHNILGIETAEGFKLRVPLSVEGEGAVRCAAEIPVGAVVRIMGTDVDAARGAAVEATRAALDQLQGHQPKVAIFFDCVATRLRLGKEFGYELEGLKEVLGNTQFAGCNTYGQVARAEGQFSGFHNCTAVVCVLPA